MPRKPWVKLSTALTGSSMWQACTPDKGISEFLALLTWAENDGIVPADRVRQLCQVVRHCTSSMCRTKTTVNVKYLESMGIVELYENGSIRICKYVQWQGKYENNEVETSVQKPVEEKRVEEIKKRREEITTLSEKGPSDFDVWWEAYPRKEAKKVAQKAYDKARKEVSRETLLAALREQVPIWKTHPDFPKYVKHPATWLNGGCWTDKPQANFVVAQRRNASASMAGEHSDNPYSDDPEEDKELLSEVPI